MTRILIGLALGILLCLLVQGRLTLSTEHRFIREVKVGPTTEFIREVSKSKE